MQTNSIQVLGSNLYIFGIEYNLTSSLPLEDEDIKANFMQCADNIANPASAFDLNFIRENKIRFDETMVVAEDLNFWIDCVSKGAKFLNAKEALTSYRIHENHASSTKKSLLVQAQINMRKRLFALWYPDVVSNEADNIIRLCGLGTLTT